MTDLKGKKLLMLEGNTLAKLVIDKAHQLGVSVIIANWYSVEDAPAKAYADKAYTVNIFDIPAMLDIIKKENVDGLFTAFTDSHLEIYCDLCEAAGLPCFTTHDLWPIMVDKAVFKKHCIEAGLPVIEEYDVEKIENDAEYLSVIEYPVIVKPVDNSGARGISICHDSSTLTDAINRAKDFSKSKTCIVERYLRGDYCLADFMIQDGKAFFCASSDKPANDDDENNVNLPGAYIFPSRNNDIIRDTLLEAVQKFVNIIGYKNGILCLELINENDKIYVIEPQFRYGAKFQDVFLEQDCGVDQLGMLINLAITGKFEGIDLNENLPQCLKNNYVLMNILLSKGTIASIQDYSEVLKFPNVDSYFPMKTVGDEIIPDGSMIQRFGKVAMSAKTREELLGSIRFFQSNLQILDENNNNMVIKSMSNTYC